MLGSLCSVLITVRIKFCPIRVFMTSLLSDRLSFRLAAGCFLFVSCGLFSGRMRLLFGRMCVCETAGAFSVSVDSRWCRCGPVRCWSTSVLSVVGFMSVSGSYRFSPVPTRYDPHLVFLGSVLVGVGSHKFRFVCARF